MVFRLSADQIRKYIQNHYIERSRLSGEEEITIRAGDIHDEMRLKHRQPLVCDTLRGRLLEEQCNIRLINEKRGENVHQKHASNIWYTYRLL